MPSRVFIPMSQHTGAPSTPVVKKGDAVKVGTMVGESAGRISSPTHSSVSGTVADVVGMPHPLTGRPVQTVIIDSDGQDVFDPAIGERNTVGLTAEQVIAAVQTAGVVGLGGAAFPTAVKLSPPKENPIDTLLINGCECEPFLTADHRVMIENPAEVIEGIRFLALALGVANVIIAIEDNKPDAIQAVSRAATGTGFAVRKLRTRYPQGAEKQLIKACLNREVPSGCLPLHVGCVVQNVGTAVAVRDAVRFNRPLFERVLTVTGPAVREPKNIRARIGTPVRHLIDFCGGYSGPVARLVMGGPMMGIAISSDDSPILKGTSGVLVLGPEPELAEEPCIRCGACVRACPMGLAPTRLISHIRARRFDSAKAEHVLDCVECGCCAWSCPAHIRLVHGFKYAKSEIAARERRK